MDFDLAPFTLQDMATSLRSWLYLIGALVFLSLVISFLLSVARNGAAGVSGFFKGLVSFLTDV